MVLTRTAPAFVERRRRPHQRQPRHRPRDCPSPRAERFPPPPPPAPRAGGNPPTPPCACRAPARRRPDRVHVGLPQNRRRCREPPGQVVRVPQFRPLAGLRSRARVLPPPPRTRGRRARRHDAARRRRVTKDLIHHRQHRRPRTARFVGPPLRDHRLPPALCRVRKSRETASGPHPTTQQSPASHRPRRGDHARPPGPAPPRRAGCAARSTAPGASPEIRPTAVVELRVEAPFDQQPGLPRRRSGRPVPRQQGSVPFR